MRWTSGGRSPNLEDRRGRGIGTLGVGGGLVVLILSLIFGPGIFTDDGTPADSYGDVGAGLSPADSAAEEPMVLFVSHVLDDVQQTWSDAFNRAGGGFRPAKLVLFRDGTDSGCGSARSAMGPFYCPLDEKVYLDLGFFRELNSRFGAPGDLAQAYVVAHEIGHHVQHLLGTDERIRAAQRRSPGDANELSVGLELQADCYAGVWAHSAHERSKLETGDLEEGLGAASAVGDDRIEERMIGRVNVDAFTHGSSEQRVSWFRRGFESGRAAACEGGIPSGLGGGP